MLDAEEASVFKGILYVTKFVRLKSMYGQSSFGCRFRPWHIYIHCRVRFYDVTTDGAITGIYLIYSLASLQGVHLNMEEASATRMTNT
eukprot:scaffold174277_cov16-Prasinocladus_malaysianus.AAC.1